MAHDHDHEEGGGHDHGQVPATFGKAFVIGIALNFGFVIVEVVYGLLSHSMALVADAGHNLSDVLGLALSLGAMVLAKRKPTKRRTYGFRSTTIMASMVNALSLLFATGGIFWESARRFMHPEPVAGKTVIVVALIGMVVNASSAALFSAGRKGDLNVRGAFLHLAADAAVSLGVAVAGGVMLFTGWAWLDPVVGILISLVILGGTWGLLRDSTNLVLDAVPEGIDPDQVKAYLAALPGVVEIHDFHIWAMSTTETALTAHLVMPEGSCHSRFLNDACKSLHEKFKIQHSTLQVESPQAPEPCRLAPDEAL